MNTGSAQWPFPDEDYYNQARQLATLHYSLPEERVKEIFFYPDSNKKTIRLLEVHGLVGQVNHEFFVVEFSQKPNIGINFPAEIAIANEWELKQLENGSIRLPPGWEMGYPVPRAQFAAATP